MLLSPKFSQTIPKKTGSRKKKKKKKTKKKKEKEKEKEEGGDCIFHRPNINYII